MLITVFASIGLVFAVVSFIGGFKMVRRTEHPAEAFMHRVNGYITAALYVITTLLVVFVVGTTGSYYFAWAAGFGVHLLKVYLARNGLAVKYGGYSGAMILGAWLIIIFNHLPK
ncbi:MAG: hypothetical protein OEV59_00535 [Deltaproteobacteria bacterium]|nr:hypothetical protein [Deltaproteobacteria bacterium]